MLGHRQQMCNVLHMHPWLMTVGPHLWEFLLQQHGGLWVTQRFRDMSSPQRPGHLECGQLNDQTSKDAVEGIHHDATMMLMMISWRLRDQMTLIDADASRTINGWCDDLMVRRWKKTKRRRLLHASVACAYPSRRSLAV